MWNFSQALDEILLNWMYKVETQQCQPSRQFWDRRRWKSGLSILLSGTVVGENPDYVCWEI